MAFRYMRWLLVAGLLVGSTCHAMVVDSELHSFKVEIVAGGLNQPWAMQFLPDGGYLVTERPGNLVRIDANGKMNDVSGLPDVDARGQGGLHDVLLHPDYSSNQRLFMCHATEDFGGHNTEVSTAVLAGDRLNQTRVIFKAQPKSSGGRHFGCRLVIDDDGYVYVSIGDRGDRRNPQNPQTHAGSIIRITQDGNAPDNNPWVGKTGYLPELYTMGNRNPQGMTRRPGTDQIWSHEHGPQGGDELNLIRSGINYGWPVITYGANYGSGTAIGEGTHKPGMEQPVYYWVPSIAPSGMAFYQGNAFPKWQNNLFVGSLKFGLLVRLEINGDEVVREERMLEGALGRIRDVRIGPDGYVYLLTDSSRGQLVRLVPTQ